MKLNSRIQQKIVSASGAISLLVPWKVSRTWVSTNSTTTSTKSCALARHAGRVALRATSKKKPTNTRPSSTEKKMLSTLKVQKPSPYCRLARW